VFDDEQTVFKIFHIKNDLKHGEELEYFPSTTQSKISINWHEGIIQGVTKTWFKNGNLQSQREMSMNQKNGLATSWYRDGSILLIEEYRNDSLLNGEYFKKGEATPISKVISGKGTATLFDADGNFLRRTSYVDGKPSS